MADYKSPLRDVRFVLHEMLGAQARYEKMGYSEVNEELMDAILEEAAKFSDNVLAPLNESGDKEGCTWDEGKVTTPAGFKEAYQQYVDNGWPAICVSEEEGGQNMPNSFGGIVLSELRASANWAWNMYPGLSQGAVRTLSTHGTDDQKQRYLPKMVSGEWTGTMCLTEAHCGTDLGLLRTKAEPNPDGSYRISGTKIFISAGEHDIADNIIHIVLARLPDAPKGTKGISLFVVPKFNVADDGSLGEFNEVHCGSIEHKMGINASATCVMNFEESVGYLVGKPNEGLPAMFTFMNTARIGTALQGLAMTERSFQGALAYAKDRLQMRALTGPQNADGEADPIIVHPDVRRMLLTQKAFAEGGRAFMYWMAIIADESALDGEDGSKADDLLSFLTPIAKAFLTETSLEATSHGMQIFGGHGYIQEWGMEQIARDARIGTIYEGTTGVQAIDLIGRKVLGSGGELLKNYTKIVYEFCKENEGDEAMAQFIEPLAAMNKEIGELTMHIGGKAMENPNEAGAASVDYLMYAGYFVMAHMWAWIAKVSMDKQDQDFYKAKVQTAQFYYQRLLAPRAVMHKTGIMSGADNLMQMDVDHFQL